MAVHEVGIAELYLQLLDLAYKVAQSLEGKKPDNPWLPDCQKLALKLFYHAATIYWLSRGTRCPVPESVGGASFLDHASVTVIARSAVETYLAMFNVFFEPMTDDEFEFRHAFWLLSGFQIREGFIPPDPDLQGRVDQMKEELKTIRARIQNTKAFGMFTPSQQRRLLSLRWMPRKLSDIARAAGFGPGFFRLLYAYQSGYAHSDGLSGAQMMSSATRESQLRSIDSQMRIVVILLSKMILDYARKFPEAEAVCAADPDTLHAAVVWSGAASLVDQGLLIGVE